MMRIVDTTLADESLSGSWLSTRLGIGTQRLDAMRRAGELLGVRRPGGHDFLYPAWQFTEEGEIVDGLEWVIRAAREASLDEETLHFFMVEPNERLEGETPANLLARGRVDRVVEVLNSAGLGPL